MLLVRTCIILLLDLNVISFSLMGKKKAKGLLHSSLRCGGKARIKIQSSWLATGEPGPFAGARSVRAQSAECSVFTNSGSE